jgi:hypothetical protein
MVEYSLRRRRSARYSGHARGREVEVGLEVEVEVLVLASEVERRVVVDSARSWVCAIRDAKTAGLFMLLCCDATLCRIIVSVRRLDVIRTGVLGNSVRWHFEYPPFQLFQLCQHDAASRSMLSSLTGHTVSRV